MHKRILLILTLLVMASASGPWRVPVAQAAPLTLAERLACRQAVEQVYWERRIWPAENESARPSLAELLPSDRLQQQTEDTLRQSVALAELWGEVITPARLQAEINRMAANSQQPEALAALWQTLDNDPVLIAECLARPQLVSRLLGKLYALDEQVHGAVRAQATAELANLTGPEQLLTLSGVYQETTWEIAAANRPVRPGAVALEPAQLAERRRELAAQFAAEAAHLPVRQVSGLQEDSGRFYALAILEDNPTRLRVGVVSWDKEPLESWWANVRHQFAADVATSVASETFTYTLPTLAPANGPESWTPTQALPDPRYEHASAWTGSEMIVWGGMSVVGRYFRDGGRYDPATDTWTLMSFSGAPAAGINPAVVWTGTELLVWGTDTIGGRYNPVTDSWTPMTATNAPGPR
ncbi:MAG: hypothetical protein KDE28_26050, partial [Anaerolineales bacterium]|nr:hypothetical protein [Anaerolineales bacterium]